MAVKVIEVPWQTTLVGVRIPTTTVDGATETPTVSVLLQPELVAVAVYTLEFEGLTTVEGVVAPFDQLMVDAPKAVSVTEFPAQIVPAGIGMIVTVGALTVLMLICAVPVQKPLNPVTV